jgi:sRNA-binding regulator protein Hfq
MKKTILILTLILSNLNVFSQSNYQDVVYLKNGSVIRGVIIEQIPNQSIKLETSNGNIFVYKYEEIEKITKEQSSAEPKQKKNSNSASNSSPSSFTNQGRFIVGLSSTIGLVPNTSYGAVPAGSSLFGFSFSSVKVKSDDPNFQDNDPDKVSAFNLSPKVGYMVIDNLVVGLEFNFGTSTTNRTYEEEGVQYPSRGNSEYKNSVVLVGPFIRYYFPVGQVLPFVEVNTGFGSNNVKSSATNRYYDGFEYVTDSYDDENKYGVFTFELMAGLALPIGNHVTFDASLGFNRVSNSLKDDPDNLSISSNTFGMGIGILVSIGK